MIDNIRRTFGFIKKHPLAGRHPFSAFGRFLKWQLQSRLSNKRRIINWIGGVKVYARRGMTGVTGNIYTGLHEFEDMGFLIHLLTEEDVFFDIGANIGSYTLLAAGLKKANCFSFEPGPAAYEMLMANMALNQFQQRVTCINAAVGSTTGTIDFTVDQDTTNHVLTELDISENKISVQIVKIDDYRAYKPVLLKIDVEGFETEVLNGAKNLLAQETLLAIIIELNGSGERYQYDEEAIHLQLKEAGFNPYVYEPFRRSLKEVDKFGVFNTIYIRNITLVLDRLNNSKGFYIFGETI